MQITQNCEFVFRDRGPIRKGRLAQTRYSAEPISAYRALCWIRDNPDGATLKEICDAWHWSRSEAGAFISRMERDGIIEGSRRGGIQMLTLCDDRQ